SRLHPQTARAAICLKSWLSYFSEMDNDKIILDVVEETSTPDENIEGDEELNWVGLIDE
ncbi:23308_t:CDS:1, partial [Entrophospora sp. SA101]